MIATDPSGAYFISVGELARRLGIGRSKAYELTRTGTVRTVRLGDRVLVPIAEAARYARSLLDAAGIECERATTPPSPGGAVVEIIPGGNREEHSRAS